MIFEIDGIEVEVLKKPIKSVNLRIYPPDGLVKLSVPLRYSNKLIGQLLTDKCDWIRLHRNRILSQPSLKEPSLQTGSTIPYLGNDYFLLVTEHNGPSHVKIDRKVIHCYAPIDATDKYKQLLLDRWYKQSMSDLLPDLINKWEKKIGVKTEEWGIKKMKTRWGSCNTRAHRIWLNLNLIKKPLSCLEYVLVHELVHLLEASHNQRFYSLMTRFMPDWKENQVLLEGNQTIKEPSY